MLYTLCYIKLEVSHRGQTTAAIVRSHFLSSLSCLSESTQWYLRAMKIKAHGQIANTVKQFTGCWSSLSQGLWCADIQTFMAAGGHATLVSPRFGTPSRTVCAPARKSMCVTNPTMKLLSPRCPSCLFRSCSTDGEVVEPQTPARLALPVQEKPLPLMSVGKLTCLFRLWPWCLM